MSYKVDFEHIPGDKWNPSQNVYSIRDEKHNKIYINQEFMPGSAHMDISYGDENIPSDKRDHAMATAKALLLKAGFDENNIELKSNGGASGYTITVRKAGDGDMMKLITALTSDHVTSKESLYAVMPAEVAHKVTEIEIQKMSKMPESATALSIPEPRTESALEAKECGRDKPATTISASFLNTIDFEESTFRAFDGEKDVAQIQTSLFMPPHMTSLVANALKESGLQVAYAKGGTIDILEPADKVADALAKKEVLPNWAANQIKDAALKAHPDQAADHAKVASYGQERVQQIKMTRG